MDELAVLDDQKTVDLSQKAVRSEAIAFINRQFSKDTKSLVKLEKLKTDLQKQREQLSKQVALANQEIPSKINAAVSEGKDAEASIGDVIAQSSILHAATEQHLAECGPILPVLEAKTKDIQQLEKYLSYLNWIVKVEELSESIQSSLLAGLMVSVVDAFSELVDLSQDLSSSSCIFLHTFVKETVLFWYNVIKDKLAAELEKCLKAFGYPSVEGPAKLQNVPLVASPESRAGLETVLAQLLNLQLPASFGVPSGLSTDLVRRLTVFGCVLDPFFLPMQFILNPLKKRFKFHFFGNKPTNNLSKPEWYLSQALSWVSVHVNVLEEVIQPCFDRVGGSHIKAKQEFMRGISLMAMEKLQSDIPELLYDESLFCHCINEALLFQRGLCDSFDYPNSFPSVLHVLCEEKAFQRWIMVEKKFALELIDNMLSSTSAWKSPQTELTDGLRGLDPDKNEPEISTLRVPECVESFVTQLYVLQERSSALPGPLPKLYFLELQLYLLEDFHSRMAQVKGGEKGNPMGLKFTSILNGIHYLLTVLQEWREHPHYVQLSWYHDQYSVMVLDSSSAMPLNGNSTRLDMTTNETFDISVVSALETSKSYTFSALSHFSERLQDGLSCTNARKKFISDPNKDEDEDAKELSKSAFDKIIETCDHLRKTMLKDIVYAVMTEIKSRSQAYKKEKWTQIPPASEFVSMSLSASACEMLLILKSRFHILGMYLSPPNMRVVWERVAQELNRFVYEEVILPNHFSDGGAAQLKFDMERNLFPVFGQFVKKPESLFKEVKESCSLLTLPVGQARLLKDTVSRAASQANVSAFAFSDGGEIARDALAESGIHKLSTEHALALLNQQTSLMVNV